MNISLIYNLYSDPMIYYPTFQNNLILKPTFSYFFTIVFRLCAPLLHHDSRSSIHPSSRSRRLQFVSFLPVLSSAPSSTSAELPLPLFIDYILAFRPEAFPRMILFRFIMHRSKIDDSEHLFCFAE